jgi:DNA-binding IclR family transcriptional regulator
MLTTRRGLDVLRAFRSERDALGNAELVRRTSISKAAVSRITSTLLTLGFLTRVPGARQFQLGVRPLSIGQAYLEASPISRAARPLMQSLADELNVSTALAIANGLDMLYLAYCKGSNISTLRLGVGSLLPIAVTSLGRAYLWGLDDSSRNSLLADIAVQAGNASAERLKGITDAFNDLETVGYCMSVVEYQPDAFGVAVPVRLGTGKTLMALNAGAVFQGTDLTFLHEVIGPRLKCIAVQLEQAMSQIDCEP